MWYRLAQNVDRALETLQSKGVVEDTINKLKKMTDLALRGKYIGALMQNPLMPWNELEEKLSPNQEMKLSVQEIRFMSDIDRMVSSSDLSEDQQANFYKWIDRVALPSYRPNQNNPENYTYPKFSHMPNPIYGIYQEINHIFDWYVYHVDSNPRFNIFSMSLDDAFQASNQWHDELANQITDKKFTKIKKVKGKIVDPNVVMVFDEDTIESLGLSKKYVDWMIVKVTVESDFDLEASIMGHCLATARYYDKYKRGNCEIYSLRDESNYPHTTVEIIPPDTVKQIQGKGDRRPKPDYLTLVLHWIRQNNYYSSDKDYESYLDLRRGADEERALEAINDYLYPYEDEEERTDSLGVPIRSAQEKTPEEFFEETNLTYFVENIGTNENDSYWKSFEEISNDDDYDYGNFEDLVSTIGQLIIQNDFNVLKQMSQDERPLGTYTLAYDFQIQALQHDLDWAISEELGNIKDFRLRNGDPEFGGAKETNFDTKSPEEIEEIVNRPYQRKDSRGYGDFKEYNGIYDNYRVYFLSSLYNYVRENLPREFFELATKLSIKFDLSPINAASVVEGEKPKEGRTNTRKQLTLMSPDFLGGTSWSYAFNNKKYRLAKRV